ncbi:MAG: DNA-primase RepB domain-containing protein [Pseudomonadota bacterium]
MFDRTRVAVIRQLKGMGCARFEIGVRHPERGMLLRGWVPDEIMRGIDWLKRENAQGCDIYIRPARDCEHGLVLVDDIGRGTIQSLPYAGHEPAVVVETSPENHQVWINLGNSQSDGVRSAAARILAKKYGADLNSADHAHFGRLAGFSNRKPEHRTIQGSPWVLLRNYPGVVCSQADALVSEAQQFLQKHHTDCNVATMLRQCVPVLERSNVRDWYTGVWLSLEERFGTQLDASRADWMIAGMLFERGHDFATVADAVRQHSPRMSIRKSANIEDYLLRTVGKAQIWIELKAQGARWEDVKDKLLWLAQERTQKTSNELDLT